MQLRILCRVSLQVVDLGCCECQLLKKLRFHRQMKLLVGVDINGAKVKKHMYVLHKLPLPIEMHLNI